MTLGGLLAIIGVILAIYALARPPQRKSIGLFVPLWVVIAGLGTSGLLLLALGALIQWQVTSPGWRFALGTAAFLIPIVVTLWAVLSWHKAALTKKSEPKFKEFLLSCLRDREYDEAVRILTQNRDCLPKILTADTADLVFDRQFVEAMISARSWLHLELLTDKSLLSIFPDHRRFVDRTFRTLLVADESPLRTSALLGEGGDETIGCSHEEKALIDRTFLNPAWYHRCRVGYPLVISACEKVDSGELDNAYNRADARYGARQGVTTRSKCQLFLAEKTIAHALKAAIEQNSGETEEIHRDAADLWDIFRAVYDHSVYSRETWDEPSGCGDYPTPFGFLLAEILSDYDLICEDAWHKSDYGEKPPPEILGPVVRMWAHCVMWFTKDKGRVSSGFRMGRVRSLLEMTLSRRHAEVNATENQESRAAWTELFIENVKDAHRSWLPESREYLREAIDGMDRAKDHISQNRGWFRKELEIEGT